MKNLTNAEKIAHAHEMNARKEAVTARDAAEQKFNDQKEQLAQAISDDALANSDQSKSIVTHRERQVAEAEKELQAAEEALNAVTPSIASQFVKKIVETVRPSPPPPNPLQVFALKFEDALGKPIIAEADLSTLKIAAANWRDAWQDRNERFTEAAAKRAFMGQATMHSQFDSDVLREIRTRGLESLLSEFAAKSDAAQIRMRQMNESALPVITRALEKFIAAGESWIEKRIRSEKDEALELGLPFAPSSALLTAQRFVAQQKIRLQNLSVSGSNPADLISFVQLY